MENSALAVQTEERRFEKINGATVMFARPATPHSDVAGNIYGIFKRYLKGKRCRVYMEPDLFLDEANNVIPDVAIVCNRDIIKYDGIHGAPDLVVEVLSPRTAKRDRGSKKDLYERVGVREYWLATPKEKSIEAYHLQDGKFVLDNVYHIYTANEWGVLTDEEKAEETLSLKVSLYDDFIVDVEEIFADMLEWD